MTNKRYFLCYNFSPMILWVFACSEKSLHTISGIPGVAIVIPSSLSEWSFYSSIMSSTLQVRHSCQQSAARVPDAMLDTWSTMSAYWRQLLNELPVIQTTNRTTCPCRCAEQYLSPLLHAVLQEQQDVSDDQRHETQSKCPTLGSLLGLWKQQTSCLLCCEITTAAATRTTVWSIITMTTTKST